MKIKNIVAFLSLVALATSCDYQRNNTIKQKDPNQDDEYVYGPGPDSVARQTLIKYTAKPELELKANAIREKLYPKNN